MMVEVTMPLIILSGRSHEGSMSSLWVFVGGFIRSILVGCLHTVLVTMPNRICGYVVVGFDFKPPCIIVYHFTWVWAHFYISITQVDWGKT
jgi:hypothetical protein